MLSTLHVIWTIALLVAFLGIVVWAFSRRRRESFEQAAKSVLDDGEPPRAATAERKDG